MRRALCGHLHPVENLLEHKRPKCQGKARVCQTLSYHSYRSTTGLLWQEEPVSPPLPTPPPPPSLPPLVQSGCLGLRCSLATVIFPFSFTVSSMYVRPRSPKIVPDLAETCYAILLLYSAAASGFFFFFWLFKLEGEKSDAIMSSRSARKVSSCNENNCASCQEMFV